MLLPIQNIAKILTWEFIVSLSSSLSWHLNFVVTIHSAPKGDKIWSALKKGEKGLGMEVYCQPLLISQAVYSNFPLSPSLSFCLFLNNNNFFFSRLWVRARQRRDLLNTSCLWNPVELVAARGRKWNTCLPPRHIAFSNQISSHAGRSGTDKMSRNQSSRAHGFQLQLRMDFWQRGNDHGQNCVVHHDYSCTEQFI